MLSYYHAAAGWLGHDSSTQYLGVVGVNKDGGVGLPHSCQDGRCQHGVQEGLVDCLHLHLVSVSRLYKVSDSLRHRGAKAVQRRGH